MFWIPVFYLLIGFVISSILFKRKTTVKDDFSGPQIVGDVENFLYAIVLWPVVILVLFLEMWLNYLDS